MGKSTAPAAPDPYTTAAAQAQYGEQAANYTSALNRPNVVTPYGSTTWSIGPQTAGQPAPSSSDTSTGSGTLSIGPSSLDLSGLGLGSGALSIPGYSGVGSYGDTSGSNGALPPQYTQTVSLNPAEQSLLTTQQQQQLGLAGTAGNVLNQVTNNLSSPISGYQSSVAQTPVQTSIDASGVAPIAGAGDLAGFTQQAQNAAYQNQTQYLDPQFNQEQEQLQAQLVNSGAHPGDPAYDNAMQLFNNQKQQAYTNADNNAVQQGLAEQQALYGESANTNQQQFGQATAQEAAANQGSAQEFSQDLSGANFGNNAALTLREQPLNEYQALANGTQLNIPSFGLGGSGSTASGATASAPDIMSAFNNQYQGQLAGYNANVASTNAGLGALGTLASALILAG